MFYRIYIFLALLTVLICGVGSQWTHAQQVEKISSGKVTGRIFDKVSNKPIQFASFIVISLKDSTRIYGSESDSLGKFTVDNIPFGIYRAKVSLIGYQTRTRKNINLNPFKYEIRIDTLLLMPLGITKEEVQIIAQKERIVYDKDNKNKITINPDKDWGVNAFELLENTPMVHVDFDEKNISLMGQQGTLIYVNGMPGKYIGFETAEDLRFLSADEIDKFELVINPEAEYGVSSPGGIINIIYKRNNQTSYTGNSVLGGNSNNKYNGSLNARYNSPVISAGMSYLNGYSDLILSNALTRQLTFENNTTILNQSAETRSRDIANRLSFSWGLYLPDDYSIRSSTNYIEGFNTGSKNYESNYSGNNYNSIALSKNLMKLINTGITVMKPLSGKGHRLNVNFSYSHNRMNIENNYDQRSLLSFQTLADTTISGNDISDNINQFFTWGINYSNLFNHYINLMASYRGTYQKMIMNSDYFRYNPVSSTDIELDNKKIRQQNYDNTNSFSATISGTMIDIQYNFRLNTYLKHSLINNNALNNSFKYDLTSFDPMVGFSMDIAEGHNIGINYSISTSFPQNYQLNPFTDYSDTTNIITGNPELKAGTNKSYSINYINSNNNMVLRASGGYNLGTDLVNSIISPFAPGITRSTFANVASQENLYFSVYLTKKFFNCLDLSPDFNIRKSKYAGIGIKNEGTGWGSSLYAMLSFSNLKFETNIGYSSASFSTQEKTKPEWSMDAGAKLLLLDKKLSLTLRASDIFNSRNSNTNQYGTGLFITNNIKQTTRIVSLSLSYYFRIEAQETIEPEIQFNVLPSEF
jgi:iron complex outermembrane recepter protein